MLKIRILEIRSHPRDGWLRLKGIVPGRHRTRVMSGNVQRFRGGLVFKAHRLRASLNSRLESNKEEEEVMRDCSRRGSLTEDHAYICCRTDKGSRSALNPHSSVYLGATLWPHSGLQRDLLNNFNIDIHGPYGRKYRRDMGEILRIR